jgi:glycerol-3-phosphate dehydrogenase (NAD(P)+)
MRATRRNSVYLPSIELPAALAIDTDFQAALEHARGGLVIVATPMAGLEEMLRRIGNDAGAGVLWLCKGFEQVGGRLGHELAREVAPKLRTGVLSGPSFAIEVARGQPTALVAASSDAALCVDAVQALHGESLRVYTSDDPIGVEVGGAVKNVLAIATGIADGMPGIDGLGLNARAALITRGLAEMTRLGVALGARAETFMGLSGLGDLVLTATGDLSRNRTVGVQLAAGRTLEEILRGLGHVAEGVRCAQAVLAIARAHAIEMPITQAVCAVLFDGVAPRDAVSALLRRDSKAE